MRNMFLAAETMKSLLLVTKNVFYIHVPLLYLLVIEATVQMYVNIFNFIHIHKSFVIVSLSRHRRGA